LIIKLIPRYGGKLAFVPLTPVVLLETEMPVTALAEKSVVPVPTLGAPPPPAIVFG
jgi:hypothetical protein